MAAFGIGALRRSWLRRHVTHHFSSTLCPSRHRFGIAFDIDGVVLRGGEPIGGAPESLRQLFVDADNPVQARIPFVFLTNGGGVPESAKALELSSVLGVRILPCQVLLGHTPFKNLVDRFQNARVLAVGKGEPATVMLDYGFRRVVSMDDYVLEFKYIDPLERYKQWALPRERDKRNGQIGQSDQIDGVFVASDPVDWGRDIQVLCDVLRSGGLPGSLSGSQPSLFFAADDFEYQAAFPVQRLGMGAFRIALESIYNRIVGVPLMYTSYGKPNTIVYRSAEQALQRISRVLESDTLRSPPKDEIASNIESQNLQSADQLDAIYMIGDNPTTDILGARKVGKPWFTILTRTGCFKDGENHLLHPADMVVDNVEAAVKFILTRHLPLVHEV